MLTHHALVLFKRHTGLTNGRRVKLFGRWYDTKALTNDQPVKLVDRRHEIAKQGEDHARGTL